MADAIIIRAFMAGLIERAGGVDAAAAVIGARLGADVSKGSVSKRQSGQLDWPLVEIMALEDAVGDPCVRRWLARSLPEVAQSQTLMQAVADVAREHGEAVAAVMDFASGKGSQDRARKEVADAQAAITTLAARMEAPQ
ncbi:hypothetical protein [Gemmobacter nectariphilus]|uniref:hypothetical protein n=1 Tax=Gemmobacter nectariphilus TaxID=220343 RepID=UPI0004089048|nr:hypothetical protein [Gemmobacter nectariphilus]